MASYQEIINQIQNLQLQAEEARKQEMASAIADIKRIMTQFGISPADLGFGGRASRGKAKGMSVAAKYRDPASGKTWSGRGRRPRWAVALEAEGKDLEAYKV